MKLRRTRPGKPMALRATKLLMGGSIGRAMSISIALVIAAACTSPTLPLPPPAIPSISLGTEPGTFRLKSEGGALANALVIIVNRDAALPRDQRVDGTIADAQGSWDLVLKANAGDF